MQILLLKTIPNLGNPGELVDVKRGYARNYLVPKGFAIVATPKNIKAFTHQQKLAGARRVKFLEDVQVQVQEIQKTTLVFDEKVGPQGKLYGAVTNRMIADRLIEETGAEVDRRKIVLDDPIREIGTFEVVVRLDREVQTTIKVVVKGSYDEPAVAETAADEAVAEAASEATGEEAAEEGAVEAAPAQDEAVADEADDTASEASEVEQEIQ